MAKRMGRKIMEVNDIRVERLIEALQSGNFMEHSCDYAGINKSTVYRWLDIGQSEHERIEAGEEPDENLAHYFELYKKVKKARATAYVRNVALIQQAANNGTWQAAAWWLERTAPQQYGRKVSAEITGAKGEAINVSVTADALESKIAGLLGIAAGEENESSDSNATDAAVSST